MLRARLPLLIAVLLAGCQYKGKTSTDANTNAVKQSPPATATQSISGALLAVAQSTATTSERAYCEIMTYSGKEATVNAEWLNTDRMQGAAKAGYFVFGPDQGGKRKRTPTAKYLELLSHSKTPKADNPRLCFGTSKLIALSNLQQLNPDKYVADGVMTLSPEPWATPEVLELFGPGRNDGLNVPPSLVFYKSGDQWKVERR